MLFILKKSRSLDDVWASKTCLGFNGIIKQTSFGEKYIISRILLRDLVRNVIPRYFFLGAMRCAAPFFFAVHSAHSIERLFKRKIRTHFSIMGNTKSNSSSVDIGDQLCIVFCAQNLKGNLASDAGRVAVGYLNPTSGCISNK